MSMRTKLAIVGILSSACLAAHAAAYNFTVNYSGGNVATLAAGSDDPLTTTLQPGDSFVYTLTAAGVGQWTTLTSASIFPLFALSVSESGNRVGDFTLDFLSGASTVFTYSEVGASNSFVHLGTNSVSLVSGLVFDTFRLSDVITSDDTTGSTANSLLPWPGLAPESYKPNDIAFNVNAVPEPATYALLIAGLAAVAGVTRRRRRA